jgi:hypothetical protein
MQSSKKNIASFKIANLTGFKKPVRFKIIKNPQHEKTKNTNTDNNYINAAASCRRFANFHYWANNKLEFRQQRM